MCTVLLPPGVNPNAVNKYIKTNDRPTRLCSIGTALHVWDRLIHRQVYTDLETHRPMQHTSFQSHCFSDPTLQNKCYSNIIICKVTAGEISKSIQVHSRMEKKQADGVKKQQNQSDGQTGRQSRKRM
jgi:hypothetical protein